MHSHLPNQPLSAYNTHFRFILAITLNTLLTISQIFYAYRAHAVSLLSDGLHNLTDVLGLILAWGAQILLSRQSSARYSYGYKKSTILAALTNALLLLLSVGIIIYEASFKLLHPQTMDEVPVLILASVGMIINGGTALLFTRNKELDINIKAIFLHLILDALNSLGVVVAALLVYYTEYQWIDTIIALAIASVMLLSSWGLLRRSIDLVLGAVPRHVDLSAVQTYLMQLPGVTNLHDLHVWGLSTQETALTAHLVMPRGLLIDSDHQRISQELAQQFGIQHVTLQVEQGQSAIFCTQTLSCS